MGDFFSFQLPSNVISWFAGGVVFLTLGIRMLISRKSVKTETNLFFMRTGIFAGIGLLLYSFPSMITTDPFTIKVGFLIGIPILNGTVAYQSYYIWLTYFKRSFSYKWILVPIASLYLSLMYVEISGTLAESIAIIDNKLIFSFPTFSRYVQSLLLLQTIVIGVTLLFQSKLAKGVWPKLRLVILALVYILLGSSSIYDNLFSFGANQSSIVLISYGIASAVFLITTVAVIIVRKNDRRQ